MNNLFLHFLKGSRNVLLVLLICTGSINLNAQAQSIKQFNKRASTIANSTGQYNIKGDFQMIGNSNMIAANDPNGTDGAKGNGNNTMVYVNVDSQTSGIVNSSTAELAFPSISGVDHDCTEIVYAGLYWSGRADVGGTASETFDVLDEQSATNIKNNQSINGYNLTIASQNDNSSNTTGSYGRLATYTFTPQGAGDNIVFRFYSWRTGSYVNRTWHQKVFVQVGSQAEQELSVVMTNNNAENFAVRLVNPFPLGSGYFVSNLRKRRTNNIDSPNFYATIKQSSGVILNKKVVKFKFAGDSYQTITSTTDIHFPATDQDQIYVGYADVTTYVKSKGLGDYTVANMALREGYGDGTGYYGSWGLVVVYKNAYMTNKSIFVYDGYSFIESPGYNQFVSEELVISGFTTPPSGNVSATIGMMAGEGDATISGDQFAIQEKNTSNYLYLRHDGNTSSSSSNEYNNFFNSSIIVDGAPPRTPSFTNNYGSDIHMFKLNNSNNSIIENSQTSTKFRYGTRQDTYIIYSMVFSVDNWVPEPTATIDASSSITNNSSVEPGNSFYLQFDITNPGNEAVNNTVFSLPIYYNQEYVSSSVTYWDTSALGSQVNPVYTPAAPNQATGGTLTWDLGTLPLMSAADKTKILASLSVELQITDDCLLISASECKGFSESSASMTGTGAQSGNEETLPAVTGSEVNGGCILPVTDPFNLHVDFETSSLANCPDNLVEDPNNTTQNVMVYYSDATEIPRSTISDVFPTDTEFYSVDPTDPNFNEITHKVTGHFPTPANGSDAANVYYAVVPNMPAGCYIKILVYRTVCWEDPVNGVGLDTPVGITLMKRAGDINSDNWPMVRKGGHIALESNTKGFVITKLNNNQMNELTAAEGMMIYNTDENCLMIYDGTAWKCYTTPTCP